MKHVWAVFVALPRGWGVSPPHLMMHLSSVWSQFLSQFREIWRFRHTCPVRCSQSSTHCSQILIAAFRLSLTETIGPWNSFSPLSFLCTYLPRAPPSDKVNKSYKENKTDFLSESWVLVLFWKDDFRGIHKLQSRTDNIHETDHPRLWVRFKIRLPPDIVQNLPALLNQIHDVRHRQGVQASKLLEDKETI